MDHPIILFDGECYFCDACVHWIIAHDREKKFRFGLRESGEGRRLLAQFDIDWIDSLILIEDERIYDRSTAALRIARQLGMPWSACYLFIVLPLFLRNMVYDTIASHRYSWFGKRSSCWLPTADLQERFLVRREVIPKT